ncbi:hypothetical protein CY35_11G118000 [Sphagnum magellanicum]|nr:hypothetical protein CY35_11G118000 [Sphagnum magellanicum]
MEFDHLMKILMVGDSGVGKSSLLIRFTSDTFADMSSPTIGVDFKLKMVNKGEKRVKLTLWDTAGQERFRTLTSSYYRGAQGIVLVYDVTRRQTFTSLSDVWLKEIERYSTKEDCIKMLVGNKLDLESERVVTKKEGVDFARRHGCLFLEREIALLSMPMELCKDLPGGLGILESMQLYYVSNIAASKDATGASDHCLRQPHECVPV